MHAWVCLGVCVRERKRNRDRDGGGGQREQVCLWRLEDNFQKPALSFHEFHNKSGHEAFAASAFTHSALS